SARRRPHRARRGRRRARPDGRSGGAGETRAGLRAPPRAGLGKRTLRPLPRHGGRPRTGRRHIRVHGSDGMTPARSVDELMAVQPVIPVITIERVGDAVPLATALVGAGLRVLEVTMRTDAALACMKAMTQVSGAIVG